MKVFAGGYTIRTLMMKVYGSRDMLAREHDAGATEPQRTARDLYYTLDASWGDTLDQQRDGLPRNHRPNFDIMVRKYYEAATLVTEEMFKRTRYMDYSTYVTFAFDFSLPTWRLIFESVRIVGVGASRQHRDERRENEALFEFSVDPARYSREEALAAVRAAFPHLTITEARDGSLNAVEYTLAEDVAGGALARRASVATSGRNRVFTRMEGSGSYVNLTSGNSRGWEAGFMPYNGIAEWYWTWDYMVNLPSLADIQDQIDTWRRHRLAEFRAGRIPTDAPAPEPAAPLLSARDAGDRYHAHRTKKVHTSEIHIPTLLVPAMGTEASRRWGIEIETGAGRDITQIPDGWQRKRDGSLVSAYDGIIRHVDPSECYYAERHNIDPDDDEDDEYLDPDYCDDCGEVEVNDGTREDCVEVVSPILTSVHSDGLRSLTDDLDGKPTTTSAGIHVHVEANGLTTKMVRELVMGYDAIEWLIEASYQREVRGYCKRRSGSELIEIARQAKRFPNASLNSLRKGDRYVTVNLNSLDSHGTVEFRAMGPIYNYDYLTAWATFCREMVNVAARGGRASEWAKVRNWAGVLAMFDKYGIEYSAASAAAQVSVPAESEVVAA